MSMTPSREGPNGTVGVKGHEGAATGSPLVDPGAAGGHLPSRHLLRGRYRLTGVLDSSPLGTLYLAEELSTGRNVAVRVLDEPVPHPEAVIRRFRAGARPGAAHRTFITVLDCDLAEDGRLFLALEPVRGKPLSDAIREESPIELRRVLRVAVQIGEGLEVAHNLGVVGLDITPPSVMVVGPDDAVK